MIQTVTGPIERKDIKAALAHEHILSDLRPLVEPLDNGIFYDKITLENHGELLRNPYAVLDNAVLDDRDCLINELTLLKNADCNLITDVTTKDFGRDPVFLKKLSEETGIYIVAGCGCYIDPAVSDELKEKTVSELRDIILHDLNEGMDETDIKAGVIGEIGSGMEISENEYKFLQAAAEAQAETGVGMHIHACLWNAEGLNALKYAVKKGANPEKICVDHVDVMLNRDYILGILNEGAYIEFDDFGKEYYVDRRNRNLLLHSFASDVERVKFLKELVDRGFTKQILISNDICLKSMLHKYGGWGYDHIFKNVVPMMEDFEISEKDIKTIIRDNPIEFVERSAR